MSDDDIPHDDGKTVFDPKPASTGRRKPSEKDAASPLEGSSRPESEHIEPTTPEPIDDAVPQTVFAPSKFIGRRDATGIPDTSAAFTASPGIASIPAQDAGRVEVGAVLNGLYEVKRFIARGGMGEVWEGCNVNDAHDRVAIKVVLPALAADPNVQAMFRKEARTLKRMSHVAIAPYRAIASDPTLNVLYIVTDFVEGVNLADALSELNPDADALKGLLRRLAEGLGAAHAVGAIHRDMSPDNVILEDGRLELAKIIDFGVAKDLDPAKGTIVGDGFAGKLGYVAPEQLGDFGREVGPWTDVYSLALVLLAVVLKRNPDMGATLVEAVDRRRAPVDLSRVPAPLRPVLEAMLRPDPAQRLRSMDEVIAMISTGVADRRTRPPIPNVNAQSAPPPPSTPTPLSRARAWLADPHHRLIAFGAAGLGVVAIVIATVALVLSEPSSTPAPAKQNRSRTAASATVMLTAERMEQVRRAVETELVNLPCSWVNLERISQAEDGGVAMRLSGAARDAAAAQQVIGRAAEGHGLSVSDLDMADVISLNPGICDALDAFRPARADTSGTAPRLRMEQRSWALRQNRDVLEAHPVVRAAIGDTSLNFALLGVDPDGSVGAAVRSRADMKTKPQDTWEADTDTFQMTLTQNTVGWTGLLLVIAPGPIDMTHVAYNPIATRQPGWSESIRRTAAAEGWRTEMIWFEVRAAQ